MNIKNLIMWVIIVLLSVGLFNMFQDPSKNKSSSSIIIITHPSKDKSLNKIIKIINRRSYVKKRSKLIRIDEE